MSSDECRASAHHRTGASGALLLDAHLLLDASDRVPVRTEFRFTSATALFVTVTFVVEEGREVTWVLGRDLLCRGLSTRTGLGDVQVWPVHRQESGIARLQLNRTGAVALFELPLAPLAEWLKATYELVPAGTELHNVDWDAWAAGLHEFPEVPFD